MTDPIKITALYAENVKKVKAVFLEPAQDGLTIIGGKNAQGKTTVLDSLAWVIGGGRKAPTSPQRDGALDPPEIDVTFSNGIRAIRKGKNSDLTVFDPLGKRAGQSLLDAFRSEIAIDLPKFLNGSTADKSRMLLDILGIGTELAALNKAEQDAYAARHAFGVEVQKKVKYAEEAPEHADAPSEPVSVSELLERHKAILSQNAENQRLRDSLLTIKSRKYQLEQRISELKSQLLICETELETVTANLATAEKSTEELHDESTASIEADIANIESINARVAANIEKARATDEANEYQARYAAMSEEIEAIRRKRISLLDGAKLPLPGLNIEEGELTYLGKKWDCMSGSEQLRVGTAIARAIKPECGFVFLDKLEAFDADSLAEFGQWAVSEGLQILGTRVSTGDECSIVLEDGLPAGMAYADVVFLKPRKPESGPVNSGAAMDW